MNLKMVGTILISGLVFVGCGGGETKPAGNTAPAKNDKPAATSTDTKPTNVSAGGVNAATGSLPADFPKDIPIYTGATIVSAAMAAGTASAVLSTSDAPDKAAEFYKAELGKNGWSAPQVVDAAGNTVMSSKKEKTQLAVTISKGTDGKTMISVSSTPMP